MTERPAGVPALPRLLLATGLLTAGSLVFEIALTRVLSLVYFSGFVFAVLSAALLGLGLGAALAAWRPALRSPALLSTWAALAGLTAVLVITATNLLAHVLLQLLTVMLTAIPFMLVGLLLGCVFSLRPAESHPLYWADLTGAGLGALLALPLLSWVDATGGALLGAVLLVAAALVLDRRNAVAIITLSLVGALGGGHTAWNWLEPDLARLAAAKPITAQLAAGGMVVQTRSTAFARSDLVYRPDLDAHYLYMDGASGSFVPETGDPRLQRDIGFLPFAVLAPRSAFLLGSGGGLDVALARAGGTERLVAAELNAGGLDIINALAPHMYADVELLVDEGRSALRRQGERYDLILLSHVITQSGDLRGFALSEASTYTVEAFRDYLEHLNPGGVLALKLYDELTLGRAFLTAVQALAVDGISEAAATAHLFAALDTTTTPPLPLLLVAREPWQQEEAIALARGAELFGHALLFIPGLLANPPLDGIVAGTANVAAVVAEAAAGGVNLEPARDGRPFFFQFETGIPGVLAPVAYAVAVVTIIALALMAAIAARPAPGYTWRAAPFLFALLGMGFMSLELAVLQRTQLFLGHPTLALTLVLGTILIGGGVGSLLGGALTRGHPARALAVACAAAAVLGLAWLLAWPAIASAAQAAPLVVRAIVAAGSLLPIALILGIPLPSGLRLLRGNPGAVAGAWAVNGIFSLTGSVATVVLALRVGYEAAFALAIASYALAFLLVMFGRRTDVPPASAQGS